MTSNFVSRVSGLATLALAAAPFAALAVPAHAQERVHVSDLNMGSASGKAAFEARVDHAANRFCANEHNVTLRAACETGIRAEANEKIATDVRLASRI